jgi:amino acid adenylation domain-containing protein
MGSEAASLGEVFLTSARAHPARPALHVDERTYTYEALLDEAHRLAELIRRVDAGPTKLCAVYASRSSWAYAGILGILLAGRGYTPLHPSFPAARNRTILELSGATTVIADHRSEPNAAEVARDSSQVLNLVLPDSPTPPGWASGDPHHRYFGSVDLDRTSGSDLVPPEVDAAATSYLLFTSGTTGKPKGIGIRHLSVLAYLDAIDQRYEIGPEDRFSQNFELTFDLSVHDMFVCWGHGACLFVPDARTAMAPAKFIRQHELTQWFSTPSTAAMMLRLRMLGPGALPSLRTSLFCGEPLTLQCTQAWQRAAPGSVIENLYGPTEATIACTAYSFDSTVCPDECVNDVVPIGRPLGKTRVAIVDDRGRQVASGEKGQLLLAGVQLAAGYWRDPERSAASFPSPPSQELQGTWYRTGDLVSLNRQGNLIYHGREDDQIKILGHRVELQEVEAVTQKASGAATAVALGWPRTSAGADGIIVFLSGAEQSDEIILQRLKEWLPPYMVPKEIHRLESMPLSTSGKIDRKRLVELRESQG